MSGNKFENPDNMTSRVDSLRENDSPGEDSIMDLANKENEIRDELKEKGIKDQELIDYFSDKFSTETLEKIEAQKENMKAQKEKYIDTLTGFENKNALKENLPKLLSFEKRQNEDCSLLMIDLDYFKSVNDNYGHSAGDIVLQKITQIIKESLRQSDFAFRYGGEEFVIFLMGLDITKANIVAEKIRSEVEKAELDFKDKNGNDIVLKKTISIGCVDTSGSLNWKEEQDKVDTESIMNELIKNADRALYEAKETGRNKIVNYRDIESKEQPNGEE